MERIKHFTKEDYITTTWSGGNTTQIAIGPENAQYSHRDFSWRISSATVQAEFSQFTHLPDYNRFISLLSGKITLRHNEGSPIELEKHGVHYFDGAAATESLGCCTDFNLMLKKGIEGKLYCLSISHGCPYNLPIGNNVLQVIYCADGAGVFSSSQDNISISKGDSIMAENLSQPCVLTASQNSVYMISEIYSND